jgi:biotin carboxylase
VLATPSASPADARLAALIGTESSLSPADLAVAAEGVAAVTFLADAANPADDLLYQVASRLAPTVRVDLADENACVAAVQQAGAEAVVTFVDRLCPLAARLNRRIGALPGNEVPWGRKDLHRIALREAGLSRIRSARLHDGADLRDFVRTVGYPVVVRPIDGFGSRDTWSVTGPSDVDGVLADVDGDVDGLFAEEFIVGTPPPAPWIADYLSVEDFRSGADAVSFITHRLPQVWPFRETGQLLPSPLPAMEQDALAGLAGRILDTLGAKQGAFHVELKPTADTAELIEVNGRIGGFITRGVRYGTGQDLGQAALRCALGQAPGLELRWDRCVLSLFYQPPAEARRVVRSPERRALSRLPGVLAVEEIAPPGTEVHWRQGTLGMVARLWLAADDYADLRARLIGVTEFLTERFAYVDGTGQPVHDRGWLDTISR